METGTKNFWIFEHLYFVRRRRDGTYQVDVEVELKGGRRFLRKVTGRNARAAAISKFLEEEASSRAERNEPSDDQAKFRIPARNKPKALHGPVSLRQRA